MPTEEKCHQSNATIVIVSQLPLERRKSSLFIKLCFEKFLIDFEKQETFRDYNDISRVEIKCFAAVKKNNVMRLRV